MSKVKLNQTAGKVFVKSDGKRKKVEAKIPETLDNLETLEELYGSNTVPIHDDDVIITEEDSYAINIQDKNDPDYTILSLFPNSKAKVSIKGKEITEIKLIEGLFRVETKNKILLPLARINYLDNSTHFFYIEVKDDKVSISLVSGHAEIIHEQLDEKVQIQMKEQTTLTPTSIEGPMKVDQKFKDAYKIQRDFESKFIDLYEDASILQQKALITEMKKTIQENKQDIKEIREEGGDVPKGMMIGVDKLEIQLKQMQKEFKENLKRKREAPKKAKEVAEFEKKFAAREKKFQEELEAMSHEISPKDNLVQSGEELTDLEQKIQAASNELLQGSSNKSSSDDGGMTDLEKRIQAAGKELELRSPDEEESDEEEMTDLEKKIQAAGKELE